MTVGGDRHGSVASLKGSRDEAGDRIQQGRIFCIKLHHVAVVIVIRPLH